MRLQHRRSQQRKARKSSYKSTKAKLERGIFRSSLCFIFILDELLRFIYLPTLKLILPTLKLI